MKKALLVDDVKLFIAMEKSLLNRQNLQIFTANSGPEAIIIHKKEQVDLILLDLNMPGMNGDEVCRIIRSNDSLKAVSIIMVATSSNKEDIEMCMNAGANDYITKPINAVEFLNKVGEYLDIQHRQNLRVLSRIEIKAQKGNREFLSYAVNISISGMLLESADNINIGDMIKTSLFLPGSFHAINVEGTVVRKVENGADEMPHYGVKFLNITEKDRGIIEKYVESHTGKDNNV